jgi:dihydrofolate reductase
MIISQIVAHSENLAIGKNNQLLWHLPKDMAWFKEKTITHPVIMGRNTMTALKKPLPKRRNIVLSSNPNLVLPGFEWARSLEQAIEMATRTAIDEIYIIGGGKLYASSLDICHRLYITKVDARFDDADAFYPEINLAVWDTTFEEFHEQDETHKHNFSFHIFEREKNDKDK